MSSVLLALEVQNDPFRGENPTAVTIRTEHPSNSLKITQKDDFHLPYTEACYLTDRVRYREEDYDKHPNYARQFCPYTQSIPRTHGLRDNL